MSTGAPLPFPASRQTARATSRRLDVFFGGAILTILMAWFASGLLAGYVAQRHTDEAFRAVSAVIDGAEVNSLPSAARDLASYEVHVHCHFSWQGEPHFVSMSSWSGNVSRMGLRDATDLAASFKPGEPLQIFVDPTQPSHAVLDDREPRSIVPVVLMLLFTGASAFLTLVGWRGWPLSAPAAHR